VSTATDRALARPGQAVTFLKNELTIETGCRRQDQTPVSSFQGFLKVLQVINDLALAKADSL